MYDHQAFKMTTKHIMTRSHLILGKSIDIIGYVCVCTINNKSQFDFRLMAFVKPPLQSLVLFLQDRLQR